ncbi:MAG: flagellar basal-body rod protein FlgF [Micavibrio sp.]|nr:flagellar basal-body rod protein FlgF [Micavibrio sp.]|tara:strand:- start:908 stop:1633 length:726 start_codon:yes stop_codon:yes gene_type:complete
MENSLYLGLSRQMTLRTNMAITANNIANMNTPGFRGQNMLFAEYLADPRGAEDELSFVYDRGQYQSTKAGPLQQTDNPLDMALVGPGFFGVAGPGDQPTYSRAGNFQIGTTGTLQTAAGFDVLDEGGAAIQIPQDAKEISIDDNGNVSTENGQIGKIQIVEFENIQELDPLGNNLYTTAAAAIPATQTKAKQGYVEGSNINAVMEMTNMIEISRSFQSMQQAMSVENDRLRSAIAKLTKTT